MTQNAAAQFGLRRLVAALVGGEATFARCAKKAAAPQKKAVTSHSSPNVKASHTWAGGEKSRRARRVSR
ncbi:MAG: hypothetical protein WD070_05525, partial [Pirellulaceae bacterium]